MPALRPSILCLSALLLCQPVVRTAAGEVTGTVTGELVDKKSGEPVIGAPVQLDGTGPVVIADEKGRFVLERVPAGEHTLHVLDPEHLPFEAPFTVEPGETVELRYALDPAGSVDQEEIVVRARRLEQEVSDTVLEMDEVVKIPGTQGDVLKIVQSLPGVARTTMVGGGAMAGIVVRGSAPEDSRVLVDGHPVPLLYHFGGIKSVLNSDMLKRIDFLPGGFGAEFGQAIGGVVDVQTLPCTHRQFDGYVELSMLDAGFFVKGPIGEDAGFFAATRRSTVDAWLPYALEDIEGFELTVAPVYYDYQAKVDWSPTPHDRLSLLTYGSSDEMKWLMEKPISGDASIRGDFAFRIMFHRVDLAWAHAPQASDWELRVSLMGGYDSFDGSGGGFLLVSTVPHLDTRVDASWQIAKQLELGVGLAGNLSWFDLEYSMVRPPKEDTVTSSFNMLERVVGEESWLAWSGGPYLTAAWRPLETTVLTGGLRFDGYAFGPYGDWAVMPRLALHHELRPGTVFKAGVGLYHQAAPEDELSEGFGNPNLQMERAVHYTLGIEQQLPLASSLEVTFFYKDLDRLAVSDDETVYANKGIGAISGMEVLLRRELTDGLFGWLAYTMMRSKRKDAPDEPWRVFSFDQTHILTLVAGYRLPTGPTRTAHGLRDGWEFGLRFQMITGNPYTPIIGGIYDADFDNYLPIPGPINSKRLPLYHRLDLRLDYTWAFSTWALSVFLDLQNAYNHRAVWRVDYNYDYTDEAYDRELPVIPALGIRGSF